MVIRVTLTTSGGRGRSSDDQGMTRSGRSGAHGEDARTPPPAGRGQVATNVGSRPGRGARPDRASSSHRPESLQGEAGAAGGPLSLRPPGTECPQDPCPSGENGRCWFGAQREALTLGWARPLQVVLPQEARTLFSRHIASLDAPPGLCPGFPKPRVAHGGEEGAGGLNAQSARVCVASFPGLWPRSGPRSPHLGGLKQKQAGIWDENVCSLSICSPAPVEGSPS